MAEYLVTGGCGFIGSHLVDALLAVGHDVRVLDDLSTGKRTNIPLEKITLIVGDVADPETVTAAMQGVGGCFHLAAVASVQRSNEQWVPVHRVNLTGSIAVFNAARTANPAGPVPVVYASSAAVYGDNPNVPLSETERPAPLTAYGADKLGSELHARVAGHVHGVPTCGLRFFNVYGPRQDPSSPYSGVISIFASKFAGSQAVTLHGDGLQSRDFVYVGDVVKHLVAALRAASISAPVCNVCTGRETSVKALAETLAALSGAEPEIRYGPARAGDIRHSLGDPVYASQELQVSAEIELAQGLQFLLDSVAAD
ncbi:MAG TPA: NAD-dependent epimerase/dehydratase family protein [Alphaproteobacteria bacterium]|nr:NAD-dependent epimerase/dehydratase family protein [Alphaproteobacteria bacterium]